MRFKTLPYILIFITVVIFAQLACGPLTTGNNNEADRPDYSATETALAKAQADLDAQKSAATQPPVDETQAPPVVETQPPPAESFDYTTLKSGDVVYHTDFDPSDTTLDEWINFTIPESTQYNLSTQNGYILFEIDETDLGVYAIPDFIYFPREYANVLVEILEENVGSTNLNNIGVICRGSIDGWYEFGLLSGGEWFIWKFDANTGYKLLTSGGIPNFDYNSPHYVAGECVGDRLTIYVDAVQPKNGSVTDRSFKEGQVGMFVYAREHTGVKVEVQDFTVMVP